MNRPCTFCVNPVGVQIRQRGLIAKLLDRLWWLVIHLENTTRSPPPAGFVCHISVRRPTARRIRARVVGNGAREEDWGRQLGGVEGRRKARHTGTGSLVDAAKGGTKTSRRSIARRESVTRWLTRPLRGLLEGQMMSQGQLSISYSDEPLLKIVLLSKEKVLRGGQRECEREM